VYKIAIAGASTLLGRELKEALEESPLAAATLSAGRRRWQGQLDQWAMRSLCPGHRPGCL